MGVVRGPVMTESGALKRRDLNRTAALLRVVEDFQFSSSW